LPVPSFPRSPLACSALAVAAGMIIAFLLLTYKFEGNVTGFYRIGDRLPISPLLEGSHPFIYTGKQGNDGQMFLTLALDPLQRLPGTSAALDNPIYRGKRVFFPLLGWLTGLGQPALIPWTLLLVNIACIGLAVLFLAQWFESHGQSPAWSLAFLVIPSLWIALSLSMAEVVDTTLLIGAILGYRMQRARSTAALVMAAMLTRETSLLLWAGLTVSAITDRRWKQLRWLLPAPLPLLGLVAYLKLTVPNPPGRLEAGFGPAFGWPFQGLLTKVDQLLLSPPSAEAFYDRGVFLLLLATVALDLLVVLRRRELRPVSAILLFYLLPFLCVTAQVYARFPDYTRVMIYFYTLAVMALPWVIGGGRIAWLGAAGVASLGYLAGFLMEKVRTSLIEAAVLTTVAGEQEYLTGQAQLRDNGVVLRWTTR
jgi:hypothetical protein